MATLSLSLIRASRVCRLWLLPALLAAAGGAHGAVVFDGSVGTTPPGTTLSGNMTIDASQGVVNSGNLFHSFSVFNVGNTESVNFTANGLSGIQNVISRVTGTGNSTIDGPVTVSIPGADFYFINPNGVIFGANGSISATGSVYISTADAVRFANGGVFYADPTKTSTLTTVAPSAFGFLSANPASIEVNGSNIGPTTGGNAPVPPGKTFALVGGDITIDGNGFGGISAPGATVELISVASAGDVPLGTPGPDLSSFQALGNIQLTNVGLIDVTDYDGTTGSGSVYIRGGQLTLTSGYLLAQTLDTNTHGLIDIAVRGNLAVDWDPNTGYNSEIGTDFGGLTDGTGPAIGLSVGGTFTVNNGSTVASANWGTVGQPVTITAGSMSALNSGYVGTQNFGSGTGGNLTITTGSVSAQNGGQILTTNSGTGTGGDLTINANSIQASGTGGVTLSLGTETSGGNAGNLTINTGTLELSDGARISSSTGGPGNAGDTNITASGSVSITGALSGIFSASEAGPDGNAGKLNITTPLLQMDGGVIDSTTVGDGNAGSINVTVGNMQLTDGAQIRSFSGGYDINNNNALVVGSGNAGSVTVDASGTVALSGGNGLSSSNGGLPSGLLAETRGSGAGGDVVVNAGDLILSDGATISSSSLGSGLAGNIQIKLADSLNMQGGSIATQAITSDGGNISISTPRLIHLVNSQITTSVQSGVGGGGNIAIDPQFVVLQNSQIIANAYGGPGGNIQIVAGQLIADPATSITASSALGIAGTVNIVAPESDVSAGLAVLPASFLDAASLMKAGCGAARAGLSSLVEVGRGGLPPDPDDYLPSLDLDATVAHGTSQNVADYRANGMVAFASTSECQP